MMGCVRVYVGVWKGLVVNEWEGRSSVERRGQKCL